MYKGQKNLKERGEKKRKEDDKEQEKERRNRGKGRKKGKGVVKGVRKGLKHLKEIKRYQSSTDTLIRRLPFQRVV